MSFFNETQELEYSIDFSETQNESEDIGTLSNFDETQELQYSVEFSETQDEEEIQQTTPSFEENEAPNKSNIGTLSNFDETQELQYSVDFSETQDESLEKTEETELTDFEETEEPEHSMDFSSRSSSDSSDTSDSDLSSEENEDMETPDFNTLRPYDHEPTRILGRSPSPSVSPSKATKGASRIGNTEWCMCGKCQAMETEEESLCCRDTNEIPDEKFSGKRNC